MIEPVVVGFGGNVGTEAAIIERFGHVRAGLTTLGPLRSAPLYRSAPIERWRSPSPPAEPAGPLPPDSLRSALGPPQPAFLNTAVCVSVDDGRPDELIASLLALERVLGRTRESEARWGPRPIDLDILVWGSRRIQTPALEVPHPRLAERKFALAPLVALLGGDLVVPGLGPAGELLQRVAEQRCDEIAATW
jgi:2-amino-4-hydroxy-6-hydroxymethyldihydropteridine diphosphokinase